MKNNFNTINNVKEKKISINLEKIFSSEKKSNAYLKIINRQKIKNGLLKNVPYGIKANFSVQNINMSGACKILSNYICSYDATIVSLLENEGAITGLATNLDELGMGGKGIFSFAGKVYNPYDYERIIGGSSSGSAYAVSSGNLPFAIGSDTGDSVRKPAAYSGIIGFKPTWGLVSRYGLYDYAPTFDTVGWFTNSIQDTSILLDILAKYDPKDSTSIKGKQKNFSENLNGKVKKLKIAFLEKELNNINDLKIKKNFLKSINNLKKMGAIVKPINIEKKILNSLWTTYQIITFTESYSSNANLTGVNFGKRINEKNYDEFIKRTRSQFNIESKRRFYFGYFSIDENNKKELFEKALKNKVYIKKQIDVIFEDYDALIFPAITSVAPKFENLELDKIDSSEHSYMDELLLIANLSGIPSLSLPNGFNNENLPTSISINGKAFNDQVVLNIAYALENYDK